MTALIELDQINRQFHRGEVAIPVLCNISLVVNAGDFVAITGPSGSGKSTLMNVLGLLDRADGGDYRIDGQNVSSLSSDQKALLRRDRFGFIFQHYQLLAHETALGNVMMPAVYTGISRTERRQRAVELLSRLGLGNRLDHRPGQLSGGQQQRVAIARALINGAEILLADEPTGALDRQSGQELLDLLAALNRDGLTILLITHDPAVAAHAHRIIEISDGKIVSDRRTIEQRACSKRSISSITWSQPVTKGARIGDIVTMASRALSYHWLRTMLTLLGVIIGVASVVALLAVGEGARHSVMTSLAALGTDLIQVRPGAPNLRGDGGQPSTLTLADGEAITALTSVATVVPEFTNPVTLRVGRFDYQTNANATTPSFPAIRNWALSRGEFFNQTDLVGHANVAVIGQTVGRAVFASGDDPLGRFLSVNGVPFQIIGIMSAKGASPGGGDMDDIVFIPFSSGTQRLFGQRHVRAMTVKVRDVDRIDTTQETIRRLLLARHGVEDFQIRNMSGLLATADDTQKTLTLLLGTIAAIALLVGGIGVMNIMLVSVSERSREIGLRLAIGARRRDILRQFNLEAVAICILGGVIGVILGLGCAILLRQTGRPILLSLTPVLLAFGCATVTGLVFGYLPARKAAGLDPVVALAAE